MGKRTTFSTREYIESRSLPVYTAGKYTVISHKEVIESTLALLEKYKLEVIKELYKTNSSADVAQGIYVLKGKDSDTEMFFAWVNSYDKSKRFQCAIGAHIKSCDGYYIGDMGSWSRKHTGDAKDEAIETMERQIKDAHTYYSTILAHKAQMDLVILPEDLRASLLGKILFQEGYMTMEQAGVVKTLLMSPGDYKSDKDSLWSLICMISQAMIKSHPRDWMDNSIKISQYINKEFSIGAMVDGQTDLITAIAEEENKEEEVNFEL